MDDSLFERVSLSTFSEFARVLKLSGLLTTSQLETVVLSFQPEKDVGNDTERIQNAAKYLIESQLLTRWQTEKLLMGKHRGFFQSQYLIRQHIGVDSTTSYYIALNMDTQTLVRIGITIDKNGSIRIKKEGDV